MPITDDEISRRVDARIPGHPWSGIGWKLLFPAVAAAALLPFVLLALPENFRPLGYVFTGIAAFYVNHLRDKRVIDRNYERGLLWEELYRKSRNPHRFENCRIYYAQDHPAGYLYIIAMTDGPIIECVSEDVYYGFRDSFPDQLQLDDDSTDDPVTLEIKQSGTRDLADPVVINIAATYRPSALATYSRLENVPEEIRIAINKSEQGDREQPSARSESN